MKCMVLVTETIINIFYITAGTTIVIIIIIITIITTTIIIIRQAHTKKTANEGEPRRGGEKNFQMPEGYAKVHKREFFERGI